jgi:predicted permease
VLLATIGAASGLLVAQWLVSAALALVVSRTSPVRATVNVPILIFTLLVAFGAAILFGLAPALNAGRASLVTALKSGGQLSRRERFVASRLLVVGQIAVSLVLLVTAGLFARSLLYLERQSLGFDQDHVLLESLNPRLGGYTTSNVGALYRSLYDRLNVLPGIRRAALARYSPFSGNSSRGGVTVQGYAAQAGEHIEVESNLVSPSYPEAMGIRLLEGRAIGAQDAAGTTPVAMVNEAFARHFFPSESAVQHRFGFGGSDHAGDIEIVGVLDDARFHETPAQPMAFLALFQDTSESSLDCEVAVNTIGDPRSAMGPVRQATREAAPNLPVNDPRLLSDQVSSTFNSQRLAARLVNAFGGLALMLACVGLYGVMAQSVVRRTKEIGVRMALGADRRDIVWMILQETGVMLVGGLTLGLSAAAIATHFVASQLFGITPADPVSFVIALAVLTAVGTVTALVPANRASRIEPVVALRCE